MIAEASEIFGAYGGSAVAIRGRRTRAEAFGDRVMGDRHIRQLSCRTFVEVQEGYAKQAYRLTQVAAPANYLAKGGPAIESAVAWLLTREEAEQDAVLREGGRIVGEVWYANATGVPTPDLEPGTYATPAKHSVKAIPAEASKGGAKPRQLACRTFPEIHDAYQRQAFRLKKSASAGSRGKGGIVLEALMAWLLTRPTTTQDRVLAEGSRVIDAVNMAYDEGRQVPDLVPGSYAAEAPGEPAGASSKVAGKISGKSVRDTTPARTRPKAKGRDPR